MSSAAVLPIPRSLHVETLLLDEAGVTILAASDATGVHCPVCGEPADRVHSRYTRTLADLPWAGVAVRVRVRTRRFFCANPSCPRSIFAERLAGIAPAFAHRTDRERDAAGARPRDAGQPRHPAALDPRRPGGRAADPDRARRRRLGIPQGAARRHDPR
ncbi:MAG: hypothetical protein QOF01_325, partial [Thermomicrobiales bacterium]|nr:hypothetical protein [Thermomicrobiales bacterium]